ncbi:MAG TPA: fibronectin type III domain-containing protein [Baekduia sp.]|jgi:hypothetical protein
MPLPSRFAKPLLVALLCLLAVSLGTVGRASAATVDGMSDQNYGVSWPASFTDFIGSSWIGNPPSHLQIARYVTAWNVADNPNSSCFARFTSWYNQAKAQGLKVEVALWTYRNLYGEMTDCPQDQDDVGKPASNAAYSTDVTNLLNAFPGIDYVESFNEPNQSHGTPTAAEAAGYWTVANGLCQPRGCTAVAGDFLDVPGWLTYAANYKTALGSANPTNWGVHPYVAVNTHSSADLNTYNTLVGGAPHRLWFTEVGASRCSHGSTDRGNAVQDSDAAYLVNTLLPTYQPLHTFYYGFRWISDGAHPCDGTYTDTALYELDGTPRPAARTIFGPSNLAATTGGSSLVYSASAKVEGTVTPGGISAASYHVDYGTSTAYGSQTASAAIGTGLAAVPVSTTLTGLQPAKTYHYRIVATNADGQSAFGNDHTFHTVPQVGMISGGAAYVQTFPYAANGWSIIDSNGDTQMRLSGAMAAVIRGDYTYTQTAPFNCCGWQAFDTFDTRLGLTSQTNGANLAAAIRRDGNAYMQNTPFNCCGWSIIDNNDSQVSMTSPTTGGSYVGVVRNGGDAYLQHTPLSCCGWQAFDNNDAQMAMASSDSGSSAAAVIRNTNGDGTGDTYMQNAPFDCCSWSIIDNNDRQVAMARGTDGKIRVGVVRNDGSAWVQTAPVDCCSWTKVADASMNVQRLVMSGDTLAILRGDVLNGNGVASYQQAPFSPTGWQDIGAGATQTVLQGGSPTDDGDASSPAPPDADGDMVPDTDDTCPTVAGGYANRGCPNNQTQLSGDVDGDGKDDVIAVSRAADNSPSVSWFRSTGAGTPAVATPASLLTLPTWNANNTKWVAGDFTGDGKSDLLAVTGTGNGQPSLYLLRSTGTSLAAPVLINQPPAANWKWDKLDWLSGDLDGDGKDDVIAIAKDSDGHPVVTWFRSTSTTTTPSVADPVAVKDLPKPGWTVGATKWSVGDYNNDGKDDLFVASGGPAVPVAMYLLLATGSGALANPTLVKQPPAASWKWDRLQFLSGDYDGDGKDDVIAVSRGGDGAPALSALRSTSSGSTASLADPVGLVSEPAPSWNVDHLKWAVVDANGDGKDDVLGVSGSATDPSALYVFASNGSVLNAPTLVAQPPAASWKWDRLLF